MRCLYIMLMVGMLLNSACAGKNEQTKKIKEELRLFQEKAVILPNNMLAKCIDNIEPNSSLLGKPLRMVVYRNAQDCGPCSISSLLPLYLFILENEQNENFGAIVILQPSNIEELDKSLKNLRFRRTVFYDLDGSFERLNPHLPKDERFHTFLLDENNKVILVGYPVNNPKLKELYLKELNKKWK